LPGSALPAEKPTSGFFDLEAALGSDSSLDLSAAAGDDGDAAASDGAAGKQPFDEIFDQLKSEAEATPDETAPDLYYDMGLAQQRLGEFAEAVKEFEMAIACNQKVAQSYLKMAVCYRTMNNLDKAAAAIKQALALDCLTEDDKKELREEQKNIRTAGGGAGGLLGFFKRLRS
jgi:tetratricopeptide (TPR) repeat protein